MTWELLVHEVAKRGWTLIIEPAHFMDGISGAKVGMAPFNAEQDEPRITTIVRNEEIERTRGDAILDAAVELFDKLDAG